jgi:4-diphosphocytidyl-2-C-methyl-D-erythritol kinase
MKIKAYAKINLFLEITEKRKDGYHNIETIMQEIDLYDELEIKKIPEKEIIVKVKGGSPEGKDNLVYKAAKLMQNTFKINGGVYIKLKKNIPMGAGLGGGSSDSASVMKVLNKIWNINASREKLAKLGKKIGADVPFFFYGGTCLAKGIGEKLKILKKNKGLIVVLIYPNVNISTKQVYSSFKLTKQVKKCNILSLYDTINNKKWQEFLFNRLEIPAFDISQKIENVKNKLLSYPILGALMSGSGSSVYAIVPKIKLAYKIKRDFKLKGYDVWIVRTK